jgi:hypothetical protein
MLYPPVSISTKKSEMAIKNHRVISAWEMEKLSYSALSEIPDKTGTDCALSYNCVGVDGLGREGVSHGTSVGPGGLEAKNLICDPRIQKTTYEK